MLFICNRTHEIVASLKSNAAAKLISVGMGFLLEHLLMLIITA